MIRRLFRRAFVTRLAAVAASPAIVFKPAECLRTAAGGAPLANSKWEVPEDDLRSTIR